MFNTGRFNLISFNRLQDITSVVVDDEIIFIYEDEITLSSVIATDDACLLSIDEASHLLEAYYKDNLMVALEAVVYPLVYTSGHDPPAIISEDAASVFCSIMANDSLGISAQETVSIYVIENRFVDDGLVIDIEDNSWKYVIEKLGTNDDYAMEIIENISGTSHWENADEYLFSEYEQIDKSLLLSDWLLVEDTEGNSFLISNISNDHFVLMNEFVTDLNNQVNRTDDVSLETDEDQVVLVSVGDLYLLDITGYAIIEQQANDEIHIDLQTGLTINRLVDDLLPIGLADATLLSSNWKIKNHDEWLNIKTIHVKQKGIWHIVKLFYIKENNTWKSL